MLWGNNLANTAMGGSAAQHLITQARRRNPDARVVVIDPILTDTAISLGARWVPIRPGTDAALVADMVYHLLRRGLLDRAFVEENFVGFYSDTFAEQVRLAEPPDATFMGYDPTGSLAVEGDQSYEAYLMGTGAFAGTGAKTPAWAARVTGVPAATVEELAELYLDGPTATIQGWGPQRHIAGGASARAIALLCALTKNVGVRGGGTGVREVVARPSWPVPASLPSLAHRSTVDTCVSFFGWYHAIEDYRSMNDATWGVRRMDAQGVTSFAERPGAISLKAPVKFIWNYASNVMMGQHGDINEMLRIYNLPDEDDSGLAMVVTHDPYLTPTALVSDIILPGTTSFEETDVCCGGGAWAGFLVCETPVVEPLFACKSAYEVCSLLAERLGVYDEFTEGRTQEGWVEWLYDQAVEAGAELPATFEEFKAQGLFKRTDRHEPAVYERPARLATPSGRWEVFSKQAYNVSRQWDPTGGGYLPDDGMGEIHALPLFPVAPEGVGDDAAAERYPFQLIGPHPKSRAHSSYGNVAWLSQATPQQLWVNAQDAEGLGIANGNMVEVYNDRGRVQITAKVTPRIMPGVLSLPQGAWHEPQSRAAQMLGDPANADRGGCVSVLTSVRPTPLSKGNGVHTCRVALRRL